MRGGGQRFNERGVKADHPEIYQKYVEVKTQTYEPETETKEGLVQGLQFEKAYYQKLSELQQELNDNKAKLETSRIEGLDETIIEREDESGFSLKYF